MAHQPADQQTNSSVPLRAFEIRGSEVAPMDIRPRSKTADSRRNSHNLFPAMSADILTYSLTNRPDTMESHNRACIRFISCLALLLVPPRTAPSARHAPAATRVVSRPSAEKGGAPKQATANQGFRNRFAELSRANVSAERGRIGKQATMGSSSVCAFGGCPRKTFGIAISKGVLQGRGIA